MGNHTVSSFSLSPHPFLLWLPWNGDESLYKIQHSKKKKILVFCISTEITEHKNNPLMLFQKQIHPIHNSPEKSFHENWQTKSLHWKVELHFYLHYIKD